MYEFLYCIDNAAGTSDSEPEPRQHYEVHCGYCHWWGMISQLILVCMEYKKPNPSCPICLLSQWLEYKEE